MSRSSEVANSGPLPRVAADASTVGHPPEGTLARELELLLDESGGRPMSVGAIFDRLSLRGKALLMTFFAFPLCLPIGIPVLTTMLGPVLAFIAWFVISDRPLWLPHRLRDRSVQHHTLVRLNDWILRYLGPVERRLRPRLEVLSRPWPMRVHGVYVLVLALVVSLPLPVLFANLVAALPILIMGLGLLRRDGFAIIASYIACVPCIALYSALIILGREGFQHLLGL